MAKKHKNLDNIKIQWDGDLSHPQAGDDNQNIPASVDLGTWSGGHRPGWYPDKHATFTPVYFEDYDINEDGEIDLTDRGIWSSTYGRDDIATEVIDIILSPVKPTKLSATRLNYTWGDVSFLIEIADGLGTGSRRAREARLHKFDKDTKKRLIRLICRVKGEEEVYDKTKEVGDIQLKLDDVDMVIGKVVKLNISGMRDWEEVPWDYGYDK